jgi:hypothetical protein
LNSETIAVWLDPGDADVDFAGVSITATSAAAITSTSAPRTLRYASNGQNFRVLTDAPLFAAAGPAPAWRQRYDRRSARVKIMRGEIATVRIRRGARNLPDLLRERGAGSG